MFHPAFLPYLIYYPSPFAGHSTTFFSISAMLMAFSISDYGNNQPFGGGYGMEYRNNHDR